MILAFGEAFAYVWSGAYGSLDQIGVVNAALIVLQLTASGFIVILLDEMLQKGYGLGSGVSLFIALNICENILWRCLSPITLRSEYGTEFEGALIALVHLLVTKPNKVSALYQAFYRTSSPNLINLFATIAVFFLVIYLQGFQVNLKLSHKKYRGYEQKFPIKLFYTSNISVIFQTALVSNMYFMSQMLYRRFKGNFFIGLLGTWQEVGDVGRGGSIPVSGLAYWISPPRDLLAFISEPLHSLIYTAFVMVCCAFFSR
jgi:protein transport protein SEC61 subunit alpha